MKVGFLELHTHIKPSEVQNRTSVGVLGLYSSGQESIRKTAKLHTVRHRHSMQHLMIGLQSVSHCHSWV